MAFIPNLFRLKLSSKYFQLLFLKQRMVCGPLVSNFQFSTSANKLKLFESSTSPFAVTNTFEASPKAIGLEFQDSLKCNLNYFWLRDNCQCGKCVDQRSKKKLVNTLDLDPDVKPKSVQIQKHGLEIIWDEGSESKHTSFYDSLWLHRFCVGFQSEAELALLDAMPPVHLWDRSEIVSSRIETSFDEFMNSEEGLLNLTEQFHLFGLVVMRKAPLKANVVVQVMQRLTTVRNLESGSTIQIDLKPSSEEFKGMAGDGRQLEFHTNMDYLENSPGVQALHCLEAGSSAEPPHGACPPGQFYFVDGYLAANWLKEKHPESFFLLVSMPVKFRHCSHNKEFMSYQYVVNLAMRKGIAEIHFNNSSMSTVEGPAYLLEEFYKGYLLFGQKLRDPQMYVPLVLKPGDVVIFNNKRVLHARATYDKTMPGQCFEGCYGEIDDVLARLRFALKDKVFK